ncbi:BF3164 family lipoprotein [Bacteroides oleiciplenus]|uniref:DUF4221 domain-containing protein n=1 Tax=Bacteroides oleiciplenus YIT 12058 TaxID=742727 RepID=K9DX78_9BACE|nr:BF3164 family lipoprotein [Bacteroides oleiciplenus]EKU89068.1 hypothetical protein HMPREF9447_03942 [Bacteroides oleiciplenus YIT 12058]
MKHLLYIILFSLLCLSACKPRAEKGQQGETDTLSVADTRKVITDVPLVEGSVTLKEEDFGQLIELTGRHQILDEEGPIFKMAEPEMLVRDGYFLLQNRPAVSYTRRSDGTVEVVRPDDEGLNCFFHWYRLPDFSYITSFGMGGNGPNEFNFPHLVPSCASVDGTYLYETTAMQLYETDTVGNLKPCPFTFKSMKGTSYSDRQICVASLDTFYYVDNIPRGKAIIRTVYQGDSLQTEQIYNLAFSKKHRSWSPYIGDFIVSPSGNRMVYAYKYFRKVLVMDKSAQTVRDINFEADGVEAKNDVLTLGPDNITYYWGISATDDYFFLTYSGRTPIQVTRENGKGDGYIFVEQYDWGGNPVARYKLDHWGRVISDGEQLYQVCYMYDDPLFLYTLPGKK